MISCNPEEHLQGPGRQEKDSAGWNPEADAESTRSGSFLSTAILLFIVAQGILSPKSASAQESVTVFAASSLTSAMQAAAQDAPDGLRLRLSFGSSSQLARQIAEGAPADIFISASALWMDYLEVRGRVEPATRVDLLGNSLVVVANGRELEKFPETVLIAKSDFDFSGGFQGRLAVGDPSHVPAGIYAKQALTRMGWWPGVRDRLAPAADARGALTYVVRGECSRGIVYATDAMISPKVVVVIAFPDSSHSQIVYPMAIVEGRDDERTRSAVAYLMSADAAVMFRGFGFRALMEDENRTQSDGVVCERGEGRFVHLTPEEWDVLWLSVKVGLFAVLVSLPPGVVLGLVLARGRFRGRLLVDAICHLPLVLPPVVTGYVLLLLFGRRGVLGPFLDQVFGVQFAFTWKGAVLASAVVGFPLMLRAIRLAVEAVDPRLERAARTLGAGPARVFATVTLPLAAPGLVAGSLLTFARSLGEFGATITFVANIQGETRTIPAAVFTYLNQPDGEPAAARLAILSVILSFAALLTSEWMARRLRRSEG